MEPGVPLAILFDEEVFYIRMPHVDARGMQWAHAKRHSSIQRYLFATVVQEHRRRCDDRRRPGAWSGSWIRRMAVGG